MTESYSSIEQIKKFYGDGTSNGAHLPFNFQMINDLKKNSQADAYVKMADDWFKSIPVSRTTNWVVSVTRQTSYHFDKLFNECFIIFIIDLDWQS